MNANGWCKDSYEIKRLTLQKWNEPEGNSGDFPSRQTPSNYFYTLLAFRYFTISNSSSIFFNKLTIAFLTLLFSISICQNLLFFRLFKK